jgi:hypothetical protein
MCSGADGPALDMGRAACLGEDLLAWAGSVEAWFPIGPVGREEDLSVTSYCRKSGRPCWAFRNCGTSSRLRPGAQWMDMDHQHQATYRPQGVHMTGGTAC